MLNVAGVGGPLVPLLPAPATTRETGEEPLLEHTDLEHRFGYHPPSSDSVRELHQQMRQSIGDVADEVNHLVPDCREKSLSVTKLEEAMMWANAAIARTQ